MHVINRRALFAFAVLAACAAPQRPLHSAAVAAERDVIALHALLRAEHPGAVSDPTVQRAIEEGARDARARARRVQTPGGHEAVLRRYLARFRDGHVALQAP